MRTRLMRSKSAGMQVCLGAAVTSLAVLAAGVVAADDYAVRLKSPNEIAAVTASSPVTGYQHFLRWRRVAFMHQS